MKKIAVSLAILAAFLLPGCRLNTDYTNKHDSSCLILNKEVLSASASELDASTNTKLYAYISNSANGASVMQRVKKMNRNTYHNACTYTVSEVLRRIGVKIPTYVNRTGHLERVLAARGFKKCSDISKMMPGAIAFTSPNKTHRYSPTHVYIFLGWSSPGVARVFDNQIYDYGSFYHNRPMKFHYFKGNRRNTKEATIYFMYK